MFDANSTDVHACSYCLKEVRDNKYSIVLYIMDGKRYFCSNTCLRKFLYGYIKEFAYDCADHVHHDDNGKFLDEHNIGRWRETFKLAINATVAMLQKGNDQSLHSLIQTVGSHVLLTYELADDDANLETEGDKQ